MRSCLRPVLVLLSLLAPLLPAAAQSSPFLPEDLYRHLASEVSGDIAFDHLRTLTRHHAPNGPSQGFAELAAWIEARARDFGLEDVRILDLPFRGTGWTPLAGELWLLEPAPTPGAGLRESKLASYAEVATSLADFSRDADLEAELVDVGLGIRPADYAGKDVAGKVVLASGPPADVERLAVFQHGALGIVSFHSSRTNPIDFPDQVQWGRINPRPDAEGREPRFAFMVSHRTGLALRARLAGQRTDPPGAERGPAAPQPLRVRAHVRSRFHPGAPQQIVEGWLRGRSRGPHVILTSHIQEEKPSANDDRSGVASMLELARALPRLIAEGKLPQPERDIRFWWVNEISAPYEYFAVHPQERAQVLVNINQDMVGAHMTMGPYSRVQHVTRTPWSRPTFFNDVVESVVMALYHGNNAYLAARQAGFDTGSPYSRPLYSRLGTRDRYALELVPYFGNTDHLVFNDAFVGAAHGGITFTNWPDEYIHSSDDDIWQMDRTTLERNAVAVAALALFMAGAGPADVPRIASVLVPAALARIHRDLAATAAARIERRADAWDSRNTLAQAVVRETAAVESLRTIAAGDPAALKLITAARQSIEAAQETARASLDAAAALPSPPYPQPIGTEEIPTRIASVDEYLAKRGAVRAVPGLHGLMRFEALNFADGERTVWHIYSALRAQSLAAGEWYYGRVTPQMVVQYFRHAAEAGIVTMKPVERIRDVMVKPEPPRKKP